MQRLEVSGAVRPIYGSLGVKRLINNSMLRSRVLEANSRPANEIRRLFMKTQCSFP